MKKILLALTSLLVVSFSYGQRIDVAERDVNTMNSLARRSIIYVSPLKFSEMGFGFELGYEREIGASGTVAYNLPVSVTFSPASKDLSKGDKQVQMFYFMPGIKLYPVGCRRKLRYAIGQSLIVGAGGQTINKPEWYTEPNWYRYELRDHFVTRNKLLVGTMFNNSLNATISRRLVLGLDIGLGFAYISKVDGINQGMKGLLQGGFRMGCKL